MESRELRIGNLIKYFSDYELSKITVLDHNYCHLDNASSIDYKDIKPIPLTEECLLKFGAEDMGYNRFDFDTYEFCYLDKTKENEFIFTFQSQQICKPIRYVHQLQNLYYCLCGEELTTQELNQ